jgi:hypothetical protein
MLVCARKASVSTAAHKFKSLVCVVSGHIATAAEHRWAIHEAQLKSPLEKCITSQQPVKMGPQVCMLFMRRLRSGRLKSCLRNMGMLSELI